MERRCIQYYTPPQLGLDLFIAAVVLNAVESAPLYSRKPRSLFIPSSQPSDIELLLNS